MGKTLGIRKIRGYLPMKSHAPMTPLALAGLLAETACGIALWLVRPSDERIKAWAVVRYL